MRTHMYAHTHVNASMHESQHTCKYTRMHYTHACMYIFCTHKHTHIHTHTCIHIQGDLIGWGKKGGLVTVTVFACVF